MESTPAIVQWMNALADVTRARLLRVIEHEELSVADLCGILQLPQSTVSRHLKLLADEGWVAARPEGTSRLYRMPVEELDTAARRLWALLREQTAQMRAAAHDDQRLAAILAARQTRSQAFFSSAAGQWDKLRRDMFGERFDLMALAGLLEDTWVIGDLGCGTGQIAQTVAPFVSQVIAVDISRAMLKAARHGLGSTSNVEVRQGRLEALPIEDETLDAAVSCLVLHHVQDPATAFAEVCRVLQPGGRLLIIDMLRHDRRDYRQQMGHVWLGFEPAQIEDWLAGVGFERIRVQPLPPATHVKGPGLFAATARRPIRNRTKTGRMNA